MYSSLWRWKYRQLQLCVKVYSKKCKGHQMLRVPCVGFESDTSEKWYWKVDRKCKDVCFWDGVWDLGRFRNYGFGLRLRQLFWKRVLSLWGFKLADEAQAQNHGFENALVTIILCQSSTFVSLSFLDHGQFLGGELRHWKIRLCRSQYISQLVQNQLINS